MSPPHEPSPGLLRRLLRSDLGSLLLEFAAAVFLFVEAVLLLSSRAHWPGLLQALLWAQWLALLVGLRAAGFFRLVGPILFYDLVRTARRRRHFLFRGLYTVGLLLLLCWVWWAWTVNHTSTGEGQSAQEMSRFATSFFFTFMIAQFVILAVLTPAYTAGAIAEEKDRKTLEFILASDLRDREIVLGKLSARLANLGLLLFAGLPVLGFLQYLGGVDPALVVAGFLATVLTVLSLGALSICNSVLFRKPREAILFTYVAAAAYLLVSGGSQILLALPGLANFPSSTTWNSPVTVAHLVDGFSAGNIVVAVQRLDTEVLAGGKVEAVLPTVLRDYALFHGLLAAVLTLYAAARVRALALGEMQGRPRRPGERKLMFLRPPLGKQPMVWKEVFAGPGFSWHWLARLVLGLLVLASFVPAVIILGYFFAELLGLNDPDTFSSYEEPTLMLARMMNVWVRIVGTLVACLMLLGVAAHAAGSVSGERDRQTFDALLTSPLTASEILYAKWLGSVLSMRWGWVWLGGIYLLAVLTGGMNFFALPLLVGAWFIFAGFVAVLGMWFSIVSRTTLRATVWTLLWTVGLSFGHYLIWMCCVPLLVAGGPPGPGSEVVFRWMVGFEAFGMTPPVTLGLLAFRPEDFEAINGPDSNLFVEWLICAAAGLVVWPLIGSGLWSAAGERFRQLTNREPLLRPERQRPISVDYTSPSRANTPGT
jgi:ABC-type transport system involved in multi-copper enzyme maturation permease subunit